MSLTFQGWATLSWHHYFLELKQEYSIYMLQQNFEGHHLLASNKGKGHIEHPQILVRQPSKTILWLR